MILSQFLLFGLILTGLWSELDTLGAVVWVPLAVVLATEIHFFNQKRELTLKLAGFFEYWRTPQNLLIMGLALAPALSCLLMTWRTEFPMNGDHDHHAAAAYQGAQYWITSGWQGIVIWCVGLALAIKTKFRWWPIVTLLTLVAVSTGSKVPDHYFARYPAGFYLLSVPAELFANWFSWPDLIFPLRLTNFMAIPISLFILRPLFNQSRLGRSWILLSLLLFWQKDFTYYQISSYLEPWALMLILLACESLLSKDELNWLPCLLIGAAALIKEQAILFLPFVWWWSFPRFWRTDRIKSAAMVGAVSIAPFLIYYIYRRKSEVWRKVEFIGADGLFASERWGEWWFRFMQQFSGLSIIIPFLVTLALGYVFWRRKEIRFQLSLLALAALFQILFFFSDKVAMSWTGYPRFHLFAFGMVASAVSFAWPLNDKKMFQVGTGVIAVIQLFALVPFLRLHLDRPAALNFFEHYDSPQYFPFRSLLEQGRSQGLLYRGQSVALNAPYANFHAQAIGLGYRDLISDFRLTVKPDGFSQPICNCNEANAIWLPFKIVTGVRAGKPEYNAGNDIATKCHEQLRLTCQTVLSETLKDGQLTAVLGVGKK